MTRERIMNRLADLLEANADLFADLEAIDNGKPKSMAGAIDIAVRGIGREQGKQGIEAYLETKSVIIQM